MKADFVRGALKTHFAPPEYAIAYEVAKATGFDARRHIDAIAMDLWPSRGLMLHGIEIKVSLGDWRREKANPEKAEELAQFCDFFWIAAPESLIPKKEMPHAWGLLEVSGEGLIKVVQQGNKTDAVGIGRPFLAAMMRAATRPVGDGTLDAMLARRRAAMENDFERRVEDRAHQMSVDGGRDAAAWRDLVAALGKEPEDYFHNAAMIAAVKAVWKSGATQSFGGLQRAHETMREATDTLAAALLGAGVEVEKKPKRRRKSA